MAAAARARPPLLYLLTSPDGVPFTQDGLRDGEHLRDEMHHGFRTALADQPVPWVEVTGPRGSRVTHAVDAVAERVGASPLFLPAAPPEGHGRPSPRG